MSGNLPPFHIPKVPLILNTLWLVFPYGLVMSFVGLTEGLLTLNWLDEITGNKDDVNEQDCKVLLKNAEDIMDVDIMEDLNL